MSCVETLACWFLEELHTRILVVHHVLLLLKCSRRLYSVSWIMRTLKIPLHCLSVQTLGINSFTHMDVDANVRTDTHTHTAFYWEWKHKVFLMLQGFRKWTSALYICSHTTSVIRPGWGLGDSISSLMPLLSFFCLLMTNPVHYTSWSFTKRWLHLHLKQTSWYLPLKAHV